MVDLSSSAGDSKSVGWAEASLSIAILRSSDGGFVDVVLDALEAVLVTTLARAGHGPLDRLTVPVPLGLPGLVVGLPVALNVLNSIPPALPASSAVVEARIVAAHGLHPVGSRGGISGLGPSALGSEVHLPGVVDVIPLVGLLRLFQVLLVHHLDERRRDDVVTDSGDECILGSAVTDEDLDGESSGEESGSSNEFHGGLCGVVVCESFILFLLIAKNGVAYIPLGLRIPLIFCPKLDFNFI